MPPAGEQGRSRADRTTAGWSRAAKLAVSLALLAYLSSRGDVSELSAVLGRADPLWVGFAVLLYLASHLLNAFRWRRYVDDLGLPGDRSGFLRLYFVGLFVNLFAPGTIAGDVARGVGAGGAGTVKSALAGVVAHRLSGLVALLLLAGAAGLLQSQVVLSPAVAVAAAVIPLATWGLFLAAPALGSLLPQALRSRLSFPPSWTRASLRTTLIALPYHGLQVAAMLALAFAIALRVDSATLATFAPLANAAGMIPITVSGIGVREAVYVFLLGSVGVTAEAALALGLLGSGLVLAAGVVGGVGLLGRR